MSKYETVEVFKCPKGHTHYFDLGTRDKGVEIRCPTGGSKSLCGQPLKFAITRNIPHRGLKKVGGLGDGYLEA